MFRCLGAASGGYFFSKGPEKQEGKMWGIHPIVQNRGFLRQTGV